MADFPLHTTNYCTFSRIQSEMNRDLLHYALRNRVYPTAKEHLFISTSALCYQILSQQTVQGYQILKTTSRLITVPFRTTPTTKLNSTKYLAGHLVLDISKFVVNIVQICNRVLGIVFGVFSKRFYLKSVIIAENINLFFEKKRESLFVHCMGNEQSPRALRCGIRLLGAEFGLGVSKTHMVYRRVFQENVKIWRQKLISFMVSLFNAGLTDNTYPITFTKYFSHLGEAENEDKIKAVVAIVDDRERLGGFINEVYRELRRDVHNDITLCMLISALIRELDGEPMIRVDTLERSTLI